MSSHSSIYHVRHFNEKGYTRLCCMSCGRHFWTLDGTAKYCGDQPCVSYSFLGSPPTEHSYSMNEVRESFLSFFEQRNHKRIAKYPIVARWRDDVYFVGASIYNFQPYVTEGIIPPPANPLVISQPCVRLTDVDLVGKSGRHLTSFEMMAHHAFNSESQRMYWTDETVEYCYEYYTGTMGMKPEKINFIEDMWIGGGNAGEDLEVVVDGIELATLVFMHYKTVGEKYEPLKNFTVDTGYGLERMTWITQGTPTVYDSIFKPAIDKLTKLASYKVPDEKIFTEASRLAGLTEIKSESSLRGLRTQISAKIGVSLQELDRLMKPMELIYAIADFTRTIVYMLADGVVPSNMQSGYLARLLIRRTLRNLASLNLSLPLSEILDLQHTEVCRHFPQYKDKGRAIREIAELEEKRYKTTLERGKEFIAKQIEEEKSKGHVTLAADSLVTFYDSQGLTPDFVQQTAEKMHFEVKIPDDFFSRIAKLHERASGHAEEAWTEKIKKHVQDFQPTKLLYYEDQYLTKARAKVLGVIDNRNVVLDQTVFYPEGGGQPSDHGVLRTRKGEIEVVDVQKVNNVVVHAIEGIRPKVSEEVICEINWNRRRNLMRHHTSTHILIGASVRVLGDHVWQSGAQKDVERSRLDISHFEKITPEQLAEIERLANHAVMGDIPLEALWLPRDEAEARYGFRLYQGGAVPGKELRVIRIGDWDVEACGGTHCHSTGEIGFIKILRSERIQDGVERILFSAGTPAIDYVQREMSRLKAVADELNCPVESIEDNLGETLKQLKIARKENDALRQRIAQYEALDLLQTAKKIGSIRLLKRHSQEYDAEFLIKLSEELVRKEQDLVTIFISNEKPAAKIVVMAGQLAQKSGVNAGKIASEISRLLGGGGGGKPSFGQGGAQKLDEIDNVLGMVDTLIQKQLGEVRR